MIVLGRRITSEFWMSDNGFFLGPGLSRLLGGFWTSALWSSLAHSAATELPSLSTAKLFILHSEFSDFGGSSFPANSVCSLFVHLECVQPHDGPQLPPVDRHLHFVVLHKDFLLHEQQSPSAVFSLLTLFSLELSGVSTLILSLLSSEKRCWPRSCWLEDDTV